MLYAHWAFKNTTYALSALSIMYAGDVLRVKCKSVVDMSKPMLINISSSSPNDRSSRIKFKSTSYVSAAGWPHAVSRPSKASRNRGVICSASDREASGFRRSKARRPPRSTLVVRKTWAKYRSGLYLLHKNCGGYTYNYYSDCDSTVVRLPVDWNSTALRPFHD